VIPIPVLVGALLGCAARGPAAPLGGRRPTPWAVDVLAAAGDRTMEANYTLQTERVAGDRWRVSTRSTRGTWTDPAGPSTFDSAVPSPADPWPLTLQHVVGAVPAEVRVERGRPVALVDPDAWRREALSAVYAAPVPAEALASGEALVDAEGLLDDLARTFPGLPPPDGGDWVRQERIAGIEAVRTEVCERTGSGWRCEGTAEVAPGSDGKLFEVGVSTEIVVDGRGVASITSRYTGTAVSLAPGGAGIVDQPIAGIRSVRRGAEPSP
jgi:hypothetical protein